MNSINLAEHATELRRGLTHEGGLAGFSVVALDRGCYWTVTAMSVGRASVISPVRSSLPMPVR
jgi:hypothetical protein